MVLITNEGKTYFDPCLLKFMANKKHHQVVNMLQPHCQHNYSIEPLKKLKDSTQATLLHYAAEYGNAYIVQFLLRYKSKIDARDQLGRTPLMLAVQKADEGTIKMLLKANANIHLKNRRGKSTIQTILDLKFNRSEMIKILFEHASWHKIIEGVAPKDLTKKLADLGYTSEDTLHWGHVELMKLMLSKEGAIDAPKKAGKTLLHIAVQSREMIMARALVENGADVNALDDQKATPIFYLYKGPKVYECVESLNLLRVIVDRATLLTASTESGLMQISMALQYGNENVIKVILRSDVNLNDSDAWGNTALHYLARNCGIDHSKLLRDRSFNVNVRNKSGYTPMLLAADRGLLEAMKFFLECGAYVDETNDSKGALYRIFARDGVTDERAVELLLRHVTKADDAEVCAIFDLMVTQFQESKRPLSRAEPLIAKLAVIRGLGLEIGEFVVSRIGQISPWREYFDGCSREVERMKRIAVQHVTLFGFLAGRRKKVNAYVRNEDLVVEVKRIVDEYDCFSPYSWWVLQRFNEVVRLAKMCEKAVEAFCRLVDLKNNAWYFVAENVVNYLGVRDMRNLRLAGDE